MPRLLVFAAIAASYFLFAILLNSVGTVILQSINSFDITKPQASTLEGYKDLSIAFVSFLIASFIPRAGYKLALLAGLLLVTLACAVTPAIPEFWMIKVLFACTGTSFALVKVSVYAIIGQLATSHRMHSSVMNLVEGIFMLGVLSGYWIFAGFINADNPADIAWLDVYYLLAILGLVVALIVWLAPVQKPALPPGQSNAFQDFIATLKLTYQPLVLIFVISVFLYVLIEQGIGSWLPTFNREVIGLPVAVSIQLTSVFAVALALGRLGAGAILSRVHWYPFLNTCLIGMAILICISLPLAESAAETSVTSLSDVPVAGYLFPLIGLLMAPVYPVLNSVMLSALPNHQHAPMTGLIVVFSALGGTTGSIITGSVFAAFSGQTAFYLALIPLGMLLITLFRFHRATQRLTQL